MFVATPKIFLASDPKMPYWQFCSGSANAKKAKTLWQSVRFFTLFLSLGGGFPLWNVGLQRRRWNLGQFALNIWSMFILAVYIWVTRDSTDAVYRNAYRIHWSTISFNVNVSLSYILVFRTIFTTLWSWWHRRDLDRIFCNLDSLRSKVESSSIGRLAALLFYIILAGFAICGPKIFIYMDEEGFWVTLPLICATTMMDLVGGRSPILLFAFFAEAFINVAQSIRLRFERLVKRPKHWVWGKQDIQEVEELRTLNGKLCNVIADWSACYSTALAVGLLVDMTCLIAILYTTFMDLIPACKYDNSNLFCTAIPMAIVYCLTIASFLVLLCVQGERLYREVSGATKILNLVAYPQDEDLKQAMSTFASQVLTSNSAASIHHCFEIRLSLLPKFIGTAFTYLIIIIQFRQADSNKVRR